MDPVLRFLRDNAAPQELQDRYIKTIERARVYMEFWDANKDIGRAVAAALSPQNQPKPANAPDAKPTRQNGRPIDN
jgi:hypothetical protein